MAFPELPDDRRARPRRYRGGDAPESTGRRQPPTGPPPAADGAGHEQDWLLGAAMQHGRPVSEEEAAERAVRTRRAPDEVPPEPPRGHRYRNGFDDLTGHRPTWHGAQEPPAGAGPDAPRPRNGDASVPPVDAELESLRARYAERLGEQQTGRRGTDDRSWPPEGRTGGHRRPAEPPAPSGTGSHRRPTDAPGHPDAPGAGAPGPRRADGRPGGRPGGHPSGPGEPPLPDGRGRPGAGPPLGAPRGNGRPVRPPHPDLPPEPGPDRFGPPQGAGPPAPGATGRRAARSVPDAPGRPGPETSARPGRDAPAGPGPDAPAPFDGPPQQRGRGPQGPGPEATRRTPLPPPGRRPVPPRAEPPPGPVDDDRDGIEEFDEPGGHPRGAVEGTEMLPAPGRRRGPGGEPADRPLRPADEEFDGGFDGDPPEDEAGDGHRGEAEEPGVGKRSGPVGVAGRIAALTGRGKGPDGEKRQLAFWKEILLLIGVALLLTILIQTLLAKVYVIPSGSMETTLHGCTGCTNDRVLVDKVTYNFTDISPGDIVVFRGTDGWASETYTGETEGNPLLSGLQSLGSLIGLAPPDEKDFVKRVIAVGGQTVACCDALNQVMVDGQPLEEPYVYYLPEAGPARQIPFGPITVPDGEYWMMGDSRNNSADSRAAGHGPIPEENVIGKVRLIVLPFDRFGWVSAVDPQTTATAAGTQGLPDGLPLALGIMGTLPLAASRRGILRARAESERFLPATRRPAGWRRRS
ncbi:signal peptidase I [Pseudonocardia sp. HH130630-07]|uniref:signal peptidase I n=1 Tax=Pseudonocardia sp. HH130630-07 TaxID=1690815 RepID=UPI001E3E96D5|nr:signal peptidase I [Pseudonocardia sp. HH130630-07]